MEHCKEKSKQEKPKYESPVVVPLGEVAKGAGQPTPNCAPNGMAAQYTCVAGAGVVT